MLGGHSENEYWKHVEKLEIDADDWTDGPAMNTARSCFSIQLMGGYVYVVGGENKEGLLTDVERLEPVTGIWKHCNGLMFPRHCHTAALVSGPVCEKYIDTHGIRQRHVVTIAH